VRVVVACEFSGVVRDAFRRRGHDAVSVDLLPTEVAGPHIVGDILDVLDDGWDLMIAHPPCTYLASSGLHWNSRRPGRAAETDAAVEFVLRLWHAPIGKIAIENPIGCLSTRLRKPDQITQPHYFGDDASKSTCLWLKGLPPLMPTSIPTGRGRVVKGRERWANQTDSGQNKLAPSADRWKERSITYPGIAAAMAAQWG
jgi:hypothetical protein